MQNLVIKDRETNKCASKYIYIYITGIEYNTIYKHYLAVTVTQNLVLTQGQEH